MTAKERWAEAPDFPDYEISDRGNMRRVTAGRGAQAGKMLESWTRPDGHRTFSIRRDGKTITVRAARLVAIAFIGPPPFPEAECCHGDGKPANDHWRNLRWDTSAGNKADMLRHGTRIRHEKHPWAKLNNRQVKRIRERFAKGGVTQKRLARDYGVQQPAISRIVHSKRWAS